MKKFKFIEVVDLKKVKGGYNDSEGTETTHSECTWRLKWGNGSNEEEADTDYYGDWVSSC